MTKARVAVPAFAVLVRRVEAPEGLQTAMIGSEAIVPTPNASFPPPILFMPFHSRPHAKDVHVEHLSIVEAIQWVGLAFSHKFLH